MEINRNNYEAYLLDLLEGRLTAEDQQKVRDFLLLNPDCAKGIDDAETWVLEKSKILFPGKEQLKKEFPDASFMLTETNFDLFSVARLEGDLTLDQERDHATMVAENEEKGKEWVKWQRTKLYAETIIFAEKDQLKRRKGISRRVIWMGIVSSAAVITLLFILLRIDPLTPDSELAVEAPALQSAEKEQTRLPAIDPLPQQEATPGRHSGQPVKSRINRDTETNSDTVNQVQQEKIQPKPVRVTRLVSSNTVLMNEGEYDHIAPLDLPPASVHRTSLTLSQLTEVDLQEVFDNYTEENEISLWTIANAGIKGINRLTGADMSLLAARDDKGDVSGFRFKSKRFSIATPFERSE